MCHTVFFITSDSSKQNNGKLKLAIKLKIEDHITVILDFYVQPAKCVNY